MKWLLKLEEAAMLLLSALLLWNSNASWYWYVLLLIGPDIGMLGYWISDKAGAVTYNIFHHKGIALAIFLAGIYFNNELLQRIGVILFGHASFDRMLGYGLKYSKGFGFTHLGIIGKDRSKETQNRLD